MPMIVRGSRNWLTPVLMTALVAAFALAPLLFEARIGTEILHPVAVANSSGWSEVDLVDTFVTPPVWLFGRKRRAARRRWRRGALIFW